MSTRRRFLQTMAAVPPAVAWAPGWANTPDPSRLALVIGNNAYPDSPLHNPVNDARDMGTMLGNAGFTVSSHLDLRYRDMQAAVGRFEEAIRRPEVKLVVFYYAGHGVQLEWRNYLLPVDANADTTATLRQSCIDLNQVIGAFGKNKGKTFIIILDACRDNPFGNSYQPEQKGLSQFDAPVGSLLAYATSPGNVASDGSGKNGLYTENLLRELAVRGARIEDALKRVRLNVRLSSKGAQIPWETTSLEDDIYIVGSQKKLTEAEQEQLLETDLAEWGRIKSSKRADDWIGYLRNFPNGRFAEIAQTRLARLLAERENMAGMGAAATPMPVPAASSAPPLQRPATPQLPSAAATAPGPSTAAPAPAASGAGNGGFALELSAQAPTPALMQQASANPYSAGRYPLGRLYTVGDSATYRNSDLLTGVESKPTTVTVISVDVDSDRVVFDTGLVTDLMGNFLKFPNGAESDVPQQYNPAELQVGKNWSAGWKQKHPQWGDEFYAFDLHIAAFEKVKVPAGEFHAFRIEGRGWYRRSGANAQILSLIWLMPGLNFALKRETTVRSGSRLWRTDRSELVAMRQKTVDGACANRAAGGGTRGLVLRNSCS